VEVKTMAKATQERWFENCGGWKPSHDLNDLRAGIEAGLLNAQDEYGMTALHLATSSQWQDGVEELLRAGADTELRYFRTGETALYTAVLQKDRPITKALISAGANPDAANYWGPTPRTVANRFGLADLFAAVPTRATDWPEPRIQNAEHLADHHHPRFEIPAREEREALQPGQAVDLYVYGPKTEAKKDTVKVRITQRSGQQPDVCYRAVIEAPIECTHLPPETKEVVFGPEHVATVYIPRKSQPEKNR
jgi:hypothetical protein